MVFLLLVGIDLSIVINGVMLELLVSIIKEWVVFGIINWFLGLEILSYCLDFRLVSFDVNVFIFWLWISNLIWFCCFVMCGLLVIVNICVSNCLFVCIVNVICWFVWWIGYVFFGLRISLIFCLVNICMCFICVWK